MQVLEQGHSKSSIIELLFPLEDVAVTLHMLFPSHSPVLSLLSCLSPVRFCDPHTSLSALNKVRLD